MALAHSPSIVTSNLMLYLDAANLKSYKGEPTTNLISDPFALVGNPSPIAYTGYEHTNTRVSDLPAYEIMSPLSPFWIKAVKNNNTNGRVLFLSISGLSTGVNYCFSVYVYSNDSNLTSLVCSTDNGAVSPVSSSINYDTSKIGTVQRIHCIFTSVAGGQVIGIRSGSTNPIGTTFYLTGFQVEQKSAPTAVVSGTRGTTVATGGGWADLSGNSNHGEMINGAGVYSSTNQGSINLDGSDDYVRVSYNASSMDFSLAQTVCMWLKPLTGATAFRRNPYAQAYGGPGTITHETGGDFTYYFGTNGGDGSPYVGRGSGFNVVVNELAFITVSRNQGTNTSKWYKNGSLITTADAGGYATTANGSSNIIIGAGYVTSFLGHIYNVSVYNRALTDAEVLQNYCALRSRYGM